MEKNPHARLHISKCPWHVIWKEKNLLDYGKYFCKEIDMALVKGFNPALELQINSTQTNGGELCDFVFKDARLSLFKMPAMIYRKKIKPGASATMPWEYHAGHLYKTMGDVIRQALNEKADGIMDSALDELASYFPETDVTTLKHYQHTDFDKLP
jgi:hypothetical protein